MFDSRMNDAAYRSPTRLFENCAGLTVRIDVTVTVTYVMTLLQVFRLIEVEKRGLLDIVLLLREYELGGGLVNSMDEGS
jgi:hypothetical protein